MAMQDMIVNHIMLAKDIIVWKLQSKKIVSLTVAPRTMKLKKPTIKQHRFES